MATVIRSSRDPHYEDKRRERQLGTITDLITKIGFYYQDKKDREEEREKLQAYQTEATREALYNQREDQANQNQRAGEEFDRQLEAKSKSQVDVAGKSEAARLKAQSEAKQAERDRLKGVIKKAKSMEGLTTGNTFVDDISTSYLENKDPSFNMIEYEESLKTRGAKLKQDEYLDIQGMVKHPVTGSIISRASYQFDQKLRADNERLMFDKDQLAWSKSVYHDVEKRTKALARIKSEWEVATHYQKADVDQYFEEQKILSAFKSQGKRLGLSDDEIAVYIKTREFDIPGGKKGEKGERLTKESFADIQAIKASDYTTEALTEMYTKQLTQKGLVEVAESYTDIYDQNVPARNTYAEVPPSGAIVQKMLDMHRSLRADLLRTGDIDALERIPYALPKAYKELQSWEKNMPTAVKADYNLLMNSLGGPSAVQKAKDDFVRYRVIAELSGGLTSHIDAQSRQTLEHTIQKFIQKEDVREFTAPLTDIINQEGEEKANEAAHDAILMAAYIDNMEKFVAATQAGEENDALLPMLVHKRSSWAENVSQAVANYVNIAFGAGEYFASHIPKMGDVENFPGGQRPNEPIVTIDLGTAASKTLAKTKEVLSGDSEGKAERRENFKSEVTNLLGDGGTVDFKWPKKRKKSRTFQQRRK